MKVPDLFVGKRLFTGIGKPELLGRGNKEVRGSAYMEGPVIVGDPTKVSPSTIGSDGAPGGPSHGCGALNVSQNANSEMSPNPFYALFVKQYARVKNMMKIDLLLTVKKIKAKLIYTDVLIAKVKNFKVPHPSPSKEGMFLVHSCLEGPEVGVYVRGHIVNKTEIKLPDYWVDLVRNDSITVQLQPVGCHQDLIVKRVSNEVVTIQTQSPYPINCFYHVYGERKDVVKLQVEVEE